MPCGSQITRTLWQQSRGRSNRLAKGQNYSLNCQMGQWQGWDSRGERCVASAPSRDRARPFGAAAWSCLLGPSMGLSLVCPRATLDVTMRAIALAVLSLFTFSASAETATTCKAQADEKKLAGADLKSFTTKGERDAKPA